MDNVIRLKTVLIRQKDDDNNAQIEDLTRVAISYEIDEPSLRRVS